MIKKLMKCPYCNGVGEVVKWEPIEPVENDGRMVNCLKRVDDTCEHCKGIGYVDYVMFTIEEAEAIMKHCGLHIE